MATSTTTTTTTTAPEAYDVGVKRTGDIVIIKDSTSSGSPQITVPDDADICIVAVVSYRDASDFYLDKLSLDGSYNIYSNEFTELRKDNASSAAGYTYLYYLVDPPKGTRTLNWIWYNSAIPDEGAVFFVSFYKNVDRANPIVSHDGEQTETVSASAEVTGSIKDRIIAVGYAYNDLAQGGYLDWGDTLDERATAWFNYDRASFADRLVEESPHTIDVECGCAGGDYVTVSAGVLRYAENIPYQNVYGVERVGSIFKAGNATESASTTVTVPVDAEICVVGFAFYDNNVAGPLLDSLSFVGDGNEFTLGSDAASFTNDTGKAFLYYLIDPPEGEQTLSWEWTLEGDACDEGAAILISFYKYINRNDPIVDSGGYHGEEGSAHILLTDLSSGDLMVGMCYAYGNVYPTRSEITWDGLIYQDYHYYNGDFIELAEALASLSVERIVVDCTTDCDNFITLSCIVLRYAPLMEGGSGSQGSIGGGEFGTVNEGFGGFGFGWS